jgi:DNA modification methylase
MHAMDDNHARVERIGDAILYLGDCYTILPNLPPVDVVLTDPPYGIGADKNLRANKQHGKAAAPSKDYGQGNWDREPPSQATLDAIAATAKYTIFWGGNYFKFAPSPCWLVWDKDNGDNGYADCELAYTNLPRAVRKFRWRWMGMLQELAGQKKEDRVHPTQKPVQLMEWCIQLCPEGGTIFDPFMGSGTTGVAAANLGRKFIGVEIEPRYFDIACERIAAAYAQGRLFA